MNFIKRYLSNTKFEKRTLRQLNATIEYLAKKQFFHEKAMASNEKLVEISSENQQTIVSMTTYSRRIHDVYLVIESLGFQTVKANKIVLWLDENEFNLDNIPQMLHLQVKRGLEVRFCKNLMSYKKLVPALKQFPDSDIITVDDDFLYPHDLVEQLVYTKNLYPSSIIGTRAHKISMDKEQVLPYKKWEYEASFSKNGDHTFLTTGAGTLFPAGLLNNEFFCEKDFMSICPTADDVWVNFICIKSGISRVKVHDDRAFTSRFFELEEHKDIALNKKNVHQNHNDIQIKNITQRYEIKL